MEMENLLLRYFGTRDLVAVEAGAMRPAIERMQVDLGMEQDPGKRFALWSLLFMMGDAPDLDVAFEDDETREAARNFMDLVAAQEQG